MTADPSRATSETDGRALLRAAVVVVFKTRTHYVDQCLESLLRMDARFLSLILVPDRFVAEYTEWGVQTPCVGTIAQKRNRGIEAVPRDCPFVAFIDSDAYATPNWLSLAVARLAREAADVAAVTGPNLTPPEDGYWRQLPGLAIASKLVMGRGAYRFSDRLVQQLDNYPNATTCNMLVRRDLLSQLGGFDGSLRTAEDVEFCDRVLKAGYRIVYDARIVVFHHRRDLLRFCLQQFNEGLRLADYRRFRRAGRFWVYMPSTLVVVDAILGLVMRRPDLLLALQFVQFAIFLAEQRHGRSRHAIGAAATMWAFLVSFGLGGIFSFLGGHRLYVPNRHDPK